MIRIRLVATFERAAKRGIAPLLPLAICAVIALAQEPPKPASSQSAGSAQNPVQAPVQNQSVIPTAAQIAETQATAEQKELMAALESANQSAVDIIRVLEEFLKKHPQAAQRKDIDKVMARAAIDAKDDRRTVLYGVRAIVDSPDDLLLLDRLARSLLSLPGEDRERRQNAAASLMYSTAFASKILQAPAPDGKDVARKQDERERALARAILYQSRARTVLGENEEAERLAAKAFAAYPGEESAREWSETLDHLGRTGEAIDRLADAFTIPDAHAADPDRTADRKRLGELYRKLHGSENGLGDVVLAAYDRTAALTEERRARLVAMDPNAVEADPMRFTITGLDGKKLPLASLKGSVVILDFWATWCGPCRVQHPLYEEVKQRFKDRNDVVFLALDSDEDRTLVLPFLDQIQWTRTSVYFEDGLQRLLQVTSIPTTILFDKQGRVASRMTGFLPDKFVDQLTERIKSALAEGPLEKR